MHWQHPRWIGTVKLSGYCLDGENLRRVRQIYVYCIVSIHLYSASCSAHQSDALPVRETQREETVVTNILIFVSTLTLKTALFNRAGVGSASELFS